MPAFKYTSQANVPGPGGRQRPQAGSLRAPQVNAPLNRPVEMGGRVQQQAVREAPNAAGMVVSNALVDLGGMFYKRSMQMADQQSELEADEAISNYRRAVSDTYYSEENGLFLKTGKEGARLYSSHKGDIDNLRDTFSQGLSESAKRKYLVKVTGYHNQHLDQLAKKQYSNALDYKAQVRVQKEGDDAADIAVRIEDENFDGVLSVIRDDDPTMSTLEKEARRDRLIASALSSAAAQRIDPKEFETLAKRLEPSASQEMKNQLPDTVTKYGNFIDNLKELEQRKQEDAVVDLRKRQNEEIGAAMIAGDYEKAYSLNESSVMDYWSKERWREEITGKRSGLTTDDHATIKSEQAKLNELVWDGRFTVNVARRWAIDKPYLFSGNGAEDAMTLVNKSQKVRDALGNRKMALEMVDDYQSKGVFSDNKQENIEKSYAAREFVTGLDEKADFVNELEKYMRPEKDGKIKRFLKGFFNVEEPIAPATQQRYSEDTINKTIEQLDRAYINEDGASVYDKFGDPAEVRTLAIMYLSQQEQRFLDESDYALGVQSQEEPVNNEDDTLEQLRLKRLERENALGNYGVRQDGTPKGDGFLGPIKMADGSIMTELTIGVQIDGREMEIPTIVPTLTDEELEYLARTGKPTEAIINKAIEHAIMRMEQNLSVFAD